MTADHQHPRTDGETGSRQRPRFHNLSLVERETTFSIETSGQDKRLDVLVQARLPWLSRVKIKEYCDAERILRNGQPCPAGRKLKAGDRVTVFHPEPWEDLAEMDRIRWETLYEDKRLLVLNKPPHLVVHPAGAYRYTTLLNALHRTYLGDKRDVSDDDPAPRLVHRIDKETSGVLVVAFDREAHGALGKLFESRSEDIEKEYLALVEGRVEWDERDVTHPIGQAPHDPIRLRRAVRADGLAAHTRVRVVERFRRFSMVRCRLHTGRQHQIRVHMQAEGHPLVGDHLYGVRDELREADIERDDAPPFRHDAIYLDESVSNEEAATRIREVDAEKRREYWEMEAGRTIARPGFGRLLMSRCALHCALMAFPHPEDGRPLRIEAALPVDMLAALDYLRKTP